MAKGGQQLSPISMEVNFLLFKTNKITVSSHVIWGHTTNEISEKRTQKKVEISSLDGSYYTIFGPSCWREMICW